MVDFPNLSIDSVGALVSTLEDELGFAGGPLASHLPAEPRVPDARPAIGGANSAEKRTF